MLEEIYKEIEKFLKNLQKRRRISKKICLSLNSHFIHDVGINEIYWGDLLFQLEKRFCIDFPTDVFLAFHDQKYTEIDTFKPIVTLGGLTSFTYRLIRPGPI